MHPLKLKLFIRVGLELIRLYCYLRQPRNRERIIALFLMVPALLFLVPSYTFLLTLFQSFLFQAMLVYGFLSCYWVIKKHYRLTGLNFTIFMLLLVKINGPMSTSYEPIANGESLKILQLNLRVGNQAHGQTIDRILQLSPDFITLQEVGFDWATSLEKSLSKAYPYYHIARNKDEGQGNAVFSKYPLDHVEEIRWKGTSNIVGHVSVNGNPVSFVSLHTRSPGNKRRWKSRNAHLNWVKGLIKDSPGELLVLGDFNTVPWDKRLIHFKAETDLEDSRKSLMPTFPAWNPFVAQIPIDYILHSNGIGCDSLGAVSITSDHKAILGSFSILKN